VGKTNNRDPRSDKYRPSRKNLAFAEATEVQTHSCVLSKVSFYINFLDSYLGNA